MSVQVEKLEHNMAKLTVTVPAAELSDAVVKVYQKQKKNISVPGFRKGKVPLQMVEKMYGKGVFLEDAANSLISSSWAKAYDESGEEIVSSPKITVIQLSPDQDFIYEAEVALKPGVELGKYKGVKIDKVDVDVTDAEIDEVIDRERRNNARQITVEDRAVQDKDKVTIDFEGFTDGVAFEGGKGEDYELVIGSHSFIDTFEEQLIGKNIGDDVEVNVTFPEQYQAEELAGKPALFKVKIKGIQEEQLPELDDEFASEVSEYETVAEYKESIAKDLKERKEKSAADAREQAAIEAVIADSRMDIPEAMIETTQRQMLEEFEQRIASQGLTFDQYKMFTGTDEEKMLEQIRPQAELRIKSRLVLEAVVAAEGIKASDEDFDKEVQKIADAYKMEKDQAVEMIGEEGKEEILKDLAVTKAAEFIRDNAVEGK
ncbi:MAG: trigger factor [Lachnospiraceae bacterium]|nr:trigger factor [Lachnospiraceae bacterium]